MILTTNFRIRVYIIVNLNLKIRVSPSMKFEKVEEEKKKKTDMPSKLRGDFQNLSKARAISDRAFTCKKQLIDFIYGDKLLKELCLGTNCTAEKPDPKSVFLPTQNPTIIEFFGHLLLPWAFKPESLDSIFVANRLEKGKKHIFPRYGF